MEDLTLNLFSLFVSLDISTRESYVGLFLHFFSSTAFSLAWVSTTDQFVSANVFVCLIEWHLQKRVSEHSLPCWFISSFFKIFQCILSPSKSTKKDLSNSLLFFLNPCLYVCLFVYLDYNLLFNVVKDIIQRDLNRSV